LSDRLKHIHLTAMDGIALEGKVPGARKCLGTSDKIGYVGRGVALARQQSEDVRCSSRGGKKKSENKGEGLKKAAT